MKIEIVIQEDDLLFENAPAFYKLTESIFEIDWNYPIFPQEGNDFDFSQVIPTEIWNSLPQEEIQYLSFVGESSKVIAVGWKKGLNGLQYSIEVKFYTTIISQERETAFFIYVEHPLLPNKPIEIEWNLNILPHRGDNLLVSSFIDERGKRMLLYSWIKNIINSRSNYDIDIIQTCEKIWAFFENHFKENIESINKWLHFCNAIENASDNSHEIVKKSINNAIYYMMEDIAEVETETCIDQIIWNKKNPKDNVLAKEYITVTIILR